MADVREPAAWVNSARMSGTTYMYVEGESDERFWNKFIDSNQVKLQVCHGCKQLHAIVDEHLRQNVFSFLAVIDRDFHAILGTTPSNPNLFITDDHDLEMMMYHKGNAFHELTNAIDRGGRIADYENNGHDLLAETMEITNDIGYCKLASHRKGYNLEFAHENEKTHEIERPKYEDVINSITGAYLGVDRVVSKVHGFTVSCKLKPPKEQDVLHEVAIEKAIKYDKWQLSNGHDVSYLLPVLIHRRCKHKKKMDADTIDNVLYAGYKMDDLRLTDLYAALIKWAKVNKVKLFI